MDPLIGRELDGRYRLVAALGEGAMGRVYRADRIDGSGAVAVKVLTEDCSDQPDLRERFEREARALFGLQHPNILDVQDYGVIDGRQPYLVMELLEGKSLDEMVDEERLDPSTAFEVARQLLVGLAHAHAQSVLHRDLKTENVFVVRAPDGDVQAKLLDFGLVKFVDDDRWGEGRKLTVAGSVMGSPAYMSPEQGTGGPMDARSDVYSAGVVLYELLTGRWPFEAESRMEMLKAHLLEPIPSLAGGREGLRVRPELDAVVQRAMAKDADHRFADAQQMLAALEAVPRPAAWLDASSPAVSAVPAGSLPPPPMPFAPAQGAAAGVELSGGLTAQAGNMPGAYAPQAPAAPAPAPFAMTPPAAAQPPKSKLPLVILVAVAAVCVVTAAGAAIVALVVG